MHRKLITSNNEFDIYLELENDQEPYVVIVGKDGIEKKSKFKDSVSYVSGNHKFGMNHSDFVNLIFGNKKSLSVEEVVSRADKFNKLIIYYYGKNDLSEQIWGVRCLLCGYESKKFARFFSMCDGCNKIVRTKCHEDFVIESNKIHNNKYLYSDKYVNNNIKIKIFCTLCNSFFSQLPRSHLSGNGCPRCKISRGELAIENYLITKDIKYFWRHKLEGLRYKKDLIVDFYLPEQNKIIEYDGEGHFEISFYSRKGSKNPEQFLKDCQARDNVKDIWAKEKGIQMLRIPYWELSNINGILDKEINEPLL